LAPGAEQNSSYFKELYVTLLVCVVRDFPIAIYLARDCLYIVYRKPGNAYYIAALLFLFSSKSLSTTPSIPPTISFPLLHPTLLRCQHTYSAPLLRPEPMKTSPQIAKSFTLPLCKKGRRRRLENAGAGAGIYYEGRGRQGENKVEMEE